MQITETQVIGALAASLEDGVFTRLGDISVEQFLAEYWQQKPLLVRQAFPELPTRISADELAGLACETENARLVLEKGGRTPWEVRYGPLHDDDFKYLPSSHWTLLVNETELLVPELKQIIDPFRFLPDWRIDDLMISYAVDQGSVGPHIDEYDVFLLQAHGKRRWQLSEQAVDELNFISSSLKNLTSKNMTATISVAVTKPET